MSINRNVSIPLQHLTVKIQRYGIHNKPSPSKGEERRS